MAGAQLSRTSPGACMEDQSCENRDLTWSWHLFYKNVDREYPENVKSPRPMAELPPSEAQNRPSSPPAPQALCPGAKTKESRWGAPSSGGELSSHRPPEGS